MTSHQKIPQMTTEQGASPERSRPAADAAPKAATAGVTAAAAMGPLETNVYRKEWRASFRYRNHIAAFDAHRESDVLLKQLDRARDAAAEKAGGDAAPASKTGYRKLREAARAEDGDDEPEDDFPRYAAGRRDRAPHAVTPGRVAARLLLARMFDAQPGLLHSLRGGTPVIVVDVPDEGLMDRVVATWKSVLFSDGARLMDAAKSPGPREDEEAAYLVVKEPTKGTSKTTIRDGVLTVLSTALPFVAISPLGTTHLPDPVMKACTARIELPGVDAVTVMRTIRAVTGRHCSLRLDEEAFNGIGIDDLVIAVRFDRSPDQCVAELRRLHRLKATKKKSRDLTLDQLHGLGGARAWAKETIADIQAWRRGELNWDSVGSAIALTGPPGTGKTTFAVAFSNEISMPLIHASLAKWQSSGDAHLGALLKAMRADFDDARARKAVLLIDEIDSFPDRATVTHNCRDYVIEVVNALLEQVDGLSGREGVVLIGCANDLSRCDPALLRAGRMNRIVHIGLPEPAELVKMLRVRLGDDLREEDLREISELAVGMTGADVEKLVNDAKRKARQDGGRPMTMADLRGALVEEDERPAELMWRTCVHEAAHITTDVILFGPADIFATTTATASRLGASVRTKLPPAAGTHSEYRKRLQVILAGRVGEELFLGAGSHGAGGNTGSDLERATSLAAAMAGSLGLAGPTPLMYLGSVGDALSFLAYPAIRDAVNSELAAAAAACRSLLEDNRSALEAVAQMLSSRGRIDGAEVEIILSQLGRKPPAAGPVRSDDGVEGSNDSDADDAAHREETTVAKWS